MKPLLLLILTLLFVTACRGTSISPLYQSKTSDPLVLPIYPISARQAGHEGCVLLLVNVLASGRPASVLVHRSSGHDSLDVAAIDAVRQWRFNPGTKNGVPIDMDLFVPIPFTLRRPDDNTPEPDCGLPFGRGSSPPASAASPVSVEARAAH